MTTVLIDSPDPVTLIGGAPTDPHLFSLALTHAPRLIAADGGADQAATLGQIPFAIIGDMDSVDKQETWQNSDVKMFELTEQTSTDFEKCLYSVTAPLFLAVGFLGGRLDHDLASLQALVRYPRQPVVLIGAEDIVFACPPTLMLDLAAGTRVSLFPLAPATGTRSEGLRWSVSGLKLDPLGRVGTSNMALGGPIEVSFDGPGMLVLLPLACLDHVVERLSIPAR